LEEMANINLPKHVHIDHTDFNLKSVETYFYLVIALKLAFDSKALDANS
jgi:hypothetical protein